MTTTSPDFEGPLRLLRRRAYATRSANECRGLKGVGDHFFETFARILQDELDRRQSRAVERRYQQLGLEENLWRHSVRRSDLSRANRLDEVRLKG